MRQDIIKFGLTCLEDVVCKHAANVVLGYCIAHFETPTKTIRQVYTSLLGSSHEVGALATQALELIAPVLPNLCNAVPNDRNPFWVAIPRRILEGKDVQQTTTVFHFLVKHADLFYEYRKGFIIHMVKSLRTITQPPNPPGPSRQLVLQLMTLVLQWEQQRVEGRTFLGTEKHKFENSGEKLSLLPLCRCFAQPLTDTSEYKIPTWARAEMINYLAEFIVSLRKPLPPLSTNAKANAYHQPSVEMIKSRSLLHSLLHPQYWGDLDIDLSNIIEILLVGDPTDSKWVNSMINVLQVVRIIADVKPHILKNTPCLEKLLERSRASDNSEIYACLYEKADIIGLKMKPLLERGSVS
jgi:transformation/transcription domain-associated protein